MTIRRFMAVAALAAGLATTTGAQGQPGNEDDRSERLATYLRVGRYADARRLIDELLKVEPRDDLKNVRSVFGNGPNMGVRRGSATFRCEVSDTGVLMPAIVDRKRVTWLIDTGANVSTISDAEATRLGLVIRDSGGRAHDLAGGSTGVRIASARRVTVGRTVLQNVPFLVTSATQMPWKELPPAKQGILGLPVAIALDALRWTRSGMCHAGAAATKRESASLLPNLRYDRMSVIAAVEFEGKPLEFVLDTGNQAGTQLWERFGKEFEPLVREKGVKSSVRVTQMGGAADHETLALSNVRLSVGGKVATLARANVFSKPVGNDRYHGLLGMDVLSQATEVTIDFRSMTLRLADTSAGDAAK